MEYTVQKLARLAGISARTVRFYDEIGLLKPARVTDAGYRIYGEAEVDALQQILFFRALGLELGTIAEVMHDPAYDRVAALRNHLTALRTQKAQLDLLIRNVERTISKEEGTMTMTDQQKFEGLKRQLVEDNEQRYGEEIRGKYGDKTVDESNARMTNMDKATYDTMQQTGADILAKLKEAVQGGASPDSDTGRGIAALHKRWLGYTMPNYTKEAHLGLVQMYLADPRFTAYYDSDVPGCAQFLHDAVSAWSDTS